MNYRTHPEIIAYWNYLGGIPDFLNDYLNLKIMTRLKKIGYFCGMDYASKKVYNFKYYVSRYDHSITTALITYHCSKSKLATIAALLHDISTPIFSHVIDYMKKDFTNQEVTEQRQLVLLKNNQELKTLLKKDKISIEDINHKNFSLVDNNRPKLCADRLDGILTPGLVMIQNINIVDIYSIIDHLQVFQNADKEQELGFNNLETAQKVMAISDEINTFYHTDADIMWMLKLAQIVKYLLDKKIISEDDLYCLDESEVISMLNNTEDVYLKKLWHTFCHGEASTLAQKFPIKEKIISPIVNNKRVIHHSLH